MAKKLRPWLQKRLGKTKIFYASDYRREVTTSAPVYSTQMQNWITKVSSLGYTLPSQNELELIDAMLTAWVAAFPDSVSLHIQGLGSIEAGTVNLIDPETLQHTLSAPPPTYQHKSGVKSDGVASYINTKRTVNSYVGIETDITSGMYITESSTDFSTTKTATGARILAASNVNTSLTPLSTASTGSRQRYAAADTFPNTDMKGLYIQTYTGGQNILYKDWDNIGGGVKDQQTVTPTGPDIANEIYWLGRNGSTTGASSPGNYFPHFSNLIFAIRGGISDAQAGTIKSIVDPLLLGLGLS